MKITAQWFLNFFGNKGSDTALAYRRLFTSADGRLVLRSLSQYCNVTASSFAPGDPHQTSFNEGQRDTFNHILAAAELKPEDFLLKPMEMNRE